MTGPRDRRGPGRPTVRARRPSAAAPLAVVLAVALPVAAYAGTPPAPSVTLAALSVVHASGPAHPLGGGLDGVRDAAEAQPDDDEPDGYEPGPGGGVRRVPDLSPRGPGKRVPPATELTEPTEQPGQPEQPTQQPEQPTPPTEQPTPVPAEQAPPAPAESGRPGLLPVVALIVGIAALGALGALAFGLVRRRATTGTSTPLATAPARRPTAPAVPPARPATAPQPPPGPARADDASVLAAALRRVAADGVSPALRQQIERLLAEAPDRAALVAGCVRFRDQLRGRSPELAAALLDALGSAGVREVCADGEAFDPRRHEATDNVATTRPEEHGRVLETVRNGYVDGDRVVRLPGVVVGRLRSPDGAGGER